MNIAFPYKHTYKCLLLGKHGEFIIDYPLHCDHEKPQDRRNIIELRKRLGLFFRQYRIIKIKPYKTSKNG